MNTYNWTITDLKTVDRNSSSDHIVFVGIKIDATDGTYSAMDEYYVHLPVNDGSSFIQYQNLTESTVMNWVKDSLGPEWVKIAYRDLDNKINMQKNPPADPVSKPLPW